MCSILGVDFFADVQSITVVADQPVTSGIGWSCLVNLPHITRCSFVQVKLGDEGIQYLSECKELWELKLIDSGVTDNNLEELSRLSRLISLRLEGHGFTGNGFEGTRFEKLNRLSINHAEFNDSGLAAIKAPSLESLDLTNTRVTDACLAELDRFPELKSIVLTGTKVTPTGIAALKQSKPRLSIVYPFPKPGVLP